jgi:hypothetical protein
MPKKKLVILLVSVLITFAAGAYYGAWVERKAWRDARAVVEKDLIRRGLDHQQLGPTEIIENPGQDITYAFGYDNRDTKLDYTVQFTGPRGLEMSIWDHARDGIEKP